jgi:hypothetical protein
MSSKQRNPKDMAAEAKVPLVIPPLPLLHVQQVMRGGSVDYGVANWRKEPVKVSVYVSAIQRHFLQFQAGADEDDKSSCPHLAHIAANCLLLMDAMEHGKCEDDRAFTSEEDALRMVSMLEQYRRINTPDGR